MKVVLIALTLCPSGGPAVTPVQMVTQMLADTVEKGQVDNHDEQVQFTSYKQFCDNTAAQKKATIADAEEMSGILKADIQDMKTDAKKLMRKIGSYLEAILFSLQKTCIHIRWAVGLEAVSQNIGPLLRFFEASLSLPPILKVN